MEKKQTAVQWLIENAKGFHNSESSKAMQKQALAMEREQMISAWVDGGKMISSAKNAEQYYTQTYLDEN